MLDDETEPDWECRERAIKILRYVAKSDKGKCAVVDMKEMIGSAGDKRIQKMNELKRSESSVSVSEQTDEELYLWKTLTEAVQRRAIC